MINVQPEVVDQLELVIVRLTTIMNSGATENGV